MRLAHMAAVCTTQNWSLAHRSHALVASQTPSCRSTAATASLAPMAPCKAGGAGTVPGPCLPYPTQGNLPCARGPNIRARLDAAIMSKEWLKHPLQRPIFFVQEYVFCMHFLQYIITCELEFYYISVKQSWVRDYYIQ